MDDLDRRWRRVRLRRRRLVRCSVHVHFHLGLWRRLLLLRRLDDDRVYNRLHRVVVDRLWHDQRRGESAAERERETMSVRECTERSGGGTVSDL